MKECFAVILALMLMMSSAVLLSAQKANPASDFKYDLNGEGTGIVIQGYKGSAKEVIIPSVIEGFPVVELGYKAFQESKIVSVIIPDNVTLINSFAFSDCTSLMSVTIPDNVEDIGDGAFSGCTALNLKEKAKIKKAGYRGSFD